MSTQALAELAICGLEEVFANVSQEMKMADKVRYARKDLGHCLADAGSHVVDAGRRRPIVSLQFSQEGDNVISVLAWQLHIGQHEFAQAVHSRHQCWAIALVRGIEVKNVSTGQSHRLANLRRCLSMPDSQIRYELASQIINLGSAESYISAQQLGADLLSGTMPLKQGPPHKNQHIIGNIAVTRHQPEQSLRSKGAGTGRAFKHPLASDEPSGHAQHCFAPGFLHDKPPLAGAHLHSRSEPDNRRLWKQGGWQGLFVQSRDGRAQRLQGLGANVRIVFFRPCCSKSLAIGATSTVTLLLRASARASRSKSDLGLRINSAKTSTAIPAGS